MAVSPGGRPADASPIGTPGGRQNWLDKTGGLPKYIREVAHALIRRGHTPSSAIAIAVQQMKRWASGGGNVSPKVRAAAAKALAEWEAKRGAARARSAVNMAHVADEAAVELAQGTTMNTKTKKKPKLGTGARFKALEAELARRGARNPAALAAHIGRKRLGKQKFQQLSAKARKKA